MAWIVIIIFLTFVACIVTSERKGKSAEVYKSSHQGSRRYEANSWEIWGKFVLNEYNELTGYGIPMPPTRPQHKQPSECEIRTHHKNTSIRSIRGRREVLLLPTR